MHISMHLLMGIYLCHLISCFRSLSMWFTKLRVTNFTVRLDVFFSWDFRALVASLVSVCFVVCLLIASLRFLHVRLVLPSFCGLQSPNSMSVTDIFLLCLAPRGTVRGVSMSASSVSAFLGVPGFLTVPTNQKARLCLAQVRTESGSVSICPFHKICASSVLLGFLVILWGESFL